MKTNKIPSIFIYLWIIYSLSSENLYPQIYETHMVEMRDKIKLATDVCLPSDYNGKLPALLVRTPYDKNGMTDICKYLSQTYTIAVIIQDTRGRYASEGRFCFFRCDGAGDLQDGVDTINWIRNQTWSNGKIATYGASALGIAQYMLASSGIDLSTMIVEVATPDLYSGITFQNGCFRKSDIEDWLNAINEKWVLNEIKSHFLYDSYWDVVDVTDNFSKFNMPAIHRGGWYDIFLQGTIDAFVGIQHNGGPNAKGKQKLIIGPWAHSGVPLEDTKIGDLIFPENAKDIPQEWISLVLIWLNHYLETELDPDYINSIPNVIYYTMGDVKDRSAPGNEWRTAEDWPIMAANIRFYLQPDKNLSDKCPLQSNSYSEYIYDPSNPTPTIGGNLLSLPAGPRDQTPIENRNDVVVFTTDVLKEPMEITGRVKAHLFVSIDQKDTDIMVRLTDVYPDGKSILIMDGAQRIASRNSRERLDFVSSGEIVEVIVDLWSTSIILNKGHRLRMIISSSNYPRFEKNPNDGSSYGEIGKDIPVKVKIYHSPEYTSYIELPDPNKRDSDVIYCSSTLDAGYDINNSDTTYNDINDIYELPDTEGVDNSLIDTQFTDYNIEDLVDVKMISDTHEDIQIEMDTETNARIDSSSGCSCSIFY